MKTIQDVLRAKEGQLQQIQKEIEALKLAARLVAEESEPAAARATAPTPAPQMVMRPQATQAQPAAVAASAWDVTKPQFP